MVSNSYHFFFAQIMGELTGESTATYAVFSLTLEPELKPINSQIWLVKVGGFSLSVQNKQFSMRIVIAIALHD